MSQEDTAKTNGAFSVTSLSKREFIAAVIMAGVAAGTMGAGNDGQTMDKYWREHVSVDAVKAADALLLALEQIV